MGSVTMILVIAFSFASSLGCVNFMYSKWISPNNRVTKKYLSEVVFLLPFLIYTNPA